MLKWLIKRRIRAFEKTYGYDAGYMLELLDTDSSAFFAIAKTQALGNYRKYVPLEVYYAAALVGTVAEDCGPCTQLMIAMAIQQGADPKQLSAVLRGDDATMTEDVWLGARFARAALARTPEADALRQTILAKWGPRGVISLAFALTASRVYPTLKYALGHGQTCQRVVVAGTPVAVVRGAA